MKVHDISMEITEDMPVYKERPAKKPELKLSADHSSGEVQETELTMNLHTGTHLDAPLHMLADGASTEYFDLDQMIVPCQVVDLTWVKEKISRSEVEDLDLKEDQFILFKTVNSAPGYLKEFPKQFIYLDQEAAGFLAEAGVAGVGIDGLGIERDQPGHPTHKVLLNNEIVIVEGLRLQEVSPGEYTLILAPLKVGPSDAAPVRALLVEEFNS